MRPLEWYLQRSDAAFSYVISTVILVLRWWCTEASGELPVHKTGCKKCKEEAVQLTHEVTGQQILP